MDIQQVTSEQQINAASAIYKRCSAKRRLALRFLNGVLRPLVWFSKVEKHASLDEVRQVLVFEQGSLGDIVMLVPFLRSLRARFPGAKISILCREHGTKKSGSYDAINKGSVETLLLEQGFADELIPIAVPWMVDVSPWKRYNPFSVRWLKFLWRFRPLRARKFDLAFSGGRSDVRYNLILWLTGARRRVGYGFAGGGFLLTDVLIPDMGRPHQREVSLQLLEHLGIPAIRDQQSLRVLQDGEAFARAFLRDHGVEEGDLVVGVHAGSRVPTRQWGEENFLEVARRLRRDFGARVIWFAEPGNNLSLPRGEDLIPAAFGMRELLSLLAKCRLLVCNESGPMHLAAGVGTPVVAVFGSGFPEWFAPEGNGHRIVIRRDIWCRPCADRCRWREPYCLRLITVEQVMAAVREAVKDVVGAERKAAAAMGA